MTFVCVESRAGGIPRDDVVEDFVHEFFHRFDGRESSDVEESEEAFAVTLEIPPGCAGTPEVYAVSDTVPAQGGARPVVVLVVRVGALEWWTLLPAAVRIDGIRAEVDGRAVHVTLPKRAP